MQSRLSGFYKQSPAERVQTLQEEAGLDAPIGAITEESLSRASAGMISENVIGTISYPVSVATNFRVDSVDRLVPMAIEETSVVAAASLGAKLARECGGFETTTTGPYMIAQIQVTDIDAPHHAAAAIRGATDELIARANEQDPVLVEHGGGCEDIEVRTLSTREGPMVVVHLLVDVQDAMGGNAVNTMAEAVAPQIADLTGGDIGLRILSNLADSRLVGARCRVPPAALDRSETDLTGPQIRDRIVEAWAFATADPYRAVTHNKGIMNGIDAVTTATMNDWRAIEAGAHGYAATGGITGGDGYGPLTAYEVADNGDLLATIELPVQIGTVGGATQTHPAAEQALAVLDVDSAEELARVLGAVGLAQNLAGLRALVSEGIQRGHMKLHAENVAVQAGAPPELVEEIAAQLVAEDSVRQDRAEELLAEYDVK